MSVFTQSFESGTNGTEITSSNTAGGGTAISSVKGTGASVAFTNVAGEVIADTMSCKCVGPSGSAAYANWSGTTTRGGFFVKHRMPVVSAGGAIQVIRNSSGIMLQAQLLTSKKIQFGSASSTLYTTTALTLPGVYFIDMAVYAGTTTTDGRAKVAVYDSAGNLAGGMAAPQEFTGINTGGGLAIAFFQAGKCAATTDTSSYIFDDMRAITGAYAFGAPGSNIAPTADAGLDQSVEPWSTVTLDGSLSTDSDGTISSYSWTQTAGTAVTLSGASTVNPTFQAPASVAGGTLTFSLSVTDNSGEYSDPDTVDVAVLPVTERAVIGGVEVPLHMQSVGP